MRTRSLLLAAVAALLAVPSAASAAPVCNLVKDKANDAYIGHSVSGTSATALDIRSVDVATGKKTLVVVMRLATTKTMDDPVSVAGMSWDVSFRIANVDHRFSRRVGPGGNVVSESGSADSKTLDGVKVTVSSTAVTWTVPRANVPKLKSRGATFTNFYGGTSAPGLAYDQAPDGGVISLSRYKDGQASCVKAA